jgi:hypothetical protein
MVLLLAKYKGNVSKIPESEIPTLGNVKVIIKNKSFTTRSALDAALKNHTIPTSDVSGMVMNRIDGLGSEETKLLRNTYPQFDAANTVIFEVGRKPTSSGTALLLMFGGGVLILAGPGIWLLSRK